MSRNLSWPNQSGLTDTLRARFVLPISRPPIEDGAVCIAGNRIVGVRRWREVSGSIQGRVVDLGEVILLPGLVNAHCHLDYTRMAGQIAPPRVFTDWLKLITTSKSGWTYSDFGESWLAGARMLLRTGTTTVGDIEMAPELLPDAWSATPLRVISFLEMTGVRSRRSPAEIVREALGQIAALPDGRNRMGFSPHAPYSTTPDLLNLAAETARRNGLRLVTHVAESELELEMFMHQRGPMFDWLAKSGRDMSDCGKGSPVQYLAGLGYLGENLLAAHANYLMPRDAELLGKHKVSVAHCPRSHAYFQHRRFPLAELDSAGVNVCLGTDSLASVYQTRKQAVELNLFDEMRALAGAMPELEPESILRMATVNGAHALGREGEIGELALGSLADMITIPYVGKKSDACLAAVHHQGNVAASMIDGQWAVPPAQTEKISEAAAHNDTSLA